MDTFFLFSFLSHLWGVDTLFWVSRFSSDFSSLSKHSIFLLYNVKTQFILHLSYDVIPCPLLPISLNCSVLIVSCLSTCPNFQQLILLSCFFECESFCPSSILSFECVDACTHLFWDQNLKRTWDSYKDTREYDMCYISSTFFPILLFKWSA